MPRCRNASPGRGQWPLVWPQATATLMRQPILLSLPLLVPAAWRLAQSGVSQPVGLLSDLATAALAFSLLWHAPRLLRPAVLFFWCVLQIGAGELNEAVHRLPSWQDVRYLLDPMFLQSSVDGLHLQAPAFAVTLIGTATLAAVAPVPRSSLRALTAGLLTVLLLLPVHGWLARTLSGQEIGNRYQALHWLIIDAAARAGDYEQPAMTEEAQLPADLLQADLRGHRLLPPPAPDRRRNVLLIILEGIPGLYLPDIGSSIVGNEASPRLPALAEATAAAMLVPAFVTHSHQTIRGLYAIHCGDFSKLSFTTPKAFELQNAPERAAQCLPARLAAAGWQTHYLQGAPLAFMNKDRAMPAMGFQNVNGFEWFPEEGDAHFIWGASDDLFFRGAATYIGDLEEHRQPWFLSLLTVATHQPYAADDESVKRYGSRQAAAIAHLDQAIARFLGDLRSNGTLEDTLVVITSDESHGAPGAGWYSSWGLALVLAPEQEALPRLKNGVYGLVDIEASILDYLELPVPPAILGRSLFRDYDQSRTMVSYTGGVLRWQTADDRLYECGRDAICRISDSRLIGARPEHYATGEPGDSSRLFALAEHLDRSVAAEPATILQFAGGEERTLPTVIANEWTDNLIGAQYLDFPDRSTVQVEIGVQALSTEPEGLQLRLIMRQFEQEVATIIPPTFPLLHSGDSCTVSFSFTNEQARQAFSFHLLGAGKNTRIRLDSFTVQITTGR